MDVQTIVCWIKETFSNPQAPSWVQAAILALTAYIVWRYTKETQRLRKETQRQIELQLRPFVIFEATRDDLRVRNVGNGTAINVRVENIRLTKPNETLSVIVHFPELVPTLLSDECICIKWQLLANGEVVQGSSADPWVGILKPIIDIAKPTEINFRPEIKVKFQNVEGQWYSAREKLIYGELEIIGFGPEGAGQRTFYKGTFSLLKRGKRSTDEEYYAK